MQLPTKTTPVSKCLELAGYTTRMLGKFKDRPTLLGLIPKLQGSADALDTAQNIYAKAVKEILPTRVDVKYENYVSDLRIRKLRQKIELADGQSGGRIGSMVFPKGSSNIVRLVGPSQVTAMRDLEGRLEASAAIFSEAMTEKAAIEEHRVRYQAALDGREAAGNRARDLRAVRNVAKEQFLTDYAQAAAVVQAEFPRDRVTQDLFFDEVRSRSTAAEADQDVGDGGDAPASSQPAPAE